MDSFVAENILKKEKKLHYWITASAGWKREHSHTICEETSQKLSFGKSHHIQDKNAL